jgi:hypothetical protein
MSWLQTLVSVCPAESAQVTPVAAAATAACSFSVKAIDRPAAEFINANVNLGWLLTAELLTAASVLVHRFIQLMQLDVPSALSRRRPGSTFGVGTGFRRCSGFDMSDDASLPDESCE